MEEYKVKDDVYKNLSKKHSPQFGKIAVDKGFVTAEQLKIALVEQVEDVFSNKPHRFMGSILLEHGWITGKQIDNVVNEVYEQEYLMK